MRGGTLAPRLGLLAITVATLALAVVIGSPESPPPTAAQAPTDRLTAEITPADCGAVTAQPTSSAATPTPATEWTFPQSAYVRVAAQATAGCTFTRFDLVVGGSVVYTLTRTPLQFQLFRGQTTTVRAHFSGTPTSCTSNTGIAADCAALLAAKDTLRGTAPLNWSTGTAITEWDGVTLGGTPPRVTGLSLRMLRGTLPEKLGDLTALTSLKLEWGKLRGSIPTELGKLTKLRTLSLYRNSLGGGIPAELGKLTELRTLSLSQNFLTGGIPTELGKLTHLEDLFLYQNRLTGSIPAELEQLTNLSSLYLSENAWDGCLPRTLRTVTNNDLATLDLPSCPLPSTTLSYDSYDTTGAVTTAGSYAFLTKADDGTTTAVTTYEGLRDGTTASLRIHASDADDASRSDVYDMVEAGDLFEWKQAEDCFVRYKVISTHEPAAGAVAREFGVEWMTYAFTGCGGTVSTDASVSIMWGTLPDLGGTSLTAPVVHGPFQLVPPGWAGVVMSSEIQELPEGAPEYPGPVVYTESLTVARDFPYWREPALPAGWMFSSARSGGYDVSYGYCAMYVAADGYLAVRVCGEHAWDLRDAEDASWVASDGREGALQGVIETRRISGRPALVAYSPFGPNHSDSFTVRVRVFDAATASLYSISGFDPTLLGNNVEGVIAIARGLFESADPR